MADLFISDLGSLHFNRYNYTLPAKYQHKEMYDDTFENRKDGFVSQSFYTQKWQKTDAPFIQCITSGLGTPNVDVYDSNGKLYQSAAMNIVSDPAVLLPNIKLNYSLDLSGFPEGAYQAVISVGGTPLRISEWMEVRTSHPGTLLFEYSHSTNKYGMYFTGTALQLRVEGKLLPWYPDGSFESYTDEIADYELLDGIPILKRPLRIPPIPDWMANKLIRILFLNQTMIEGVQYSRTPESKFEKKDYPGHDMKSYLIEIARSTNSYGLATTETGDTSGLMMALTLDAQAFGNPTPGTLINIQVPND